MNKRQMAFTLAEVLITLAIIGVVAALTIPSLIINYQKQQYVTQLEKEYSQISNGFKTVMAKEGVTKMSYTAIINSISGNIPSNTNNGDQTSFQNEFAKIFKVLKFYSPKSIPTGTEERITYKNLQGILIDDMNNGLSAAFLADGSIIYYTFYKTEEPVKSRQDLMRAAGGKLIHQVAELYIDVNGIKAPNQWGRDLFCFLVGEDGTLFPYGDKDTSIFMNNGSDIDVWDNLSSDDSCKPEETDSVGYGCAARIVTQGWKMNY